MAETPLMIWHTEFSRHKFSNFNELKMVYGNDFRLVISINFLQAASYVIWFGSHKEYDKIDVQTISFDTAILTNKI